MMQHWPLIAKGSTVDIIAPSGKIEEKNISAIHAYIKNLGLTPRIPDDLLGEHPFCANHDEARWQHLINALYAEDSTLIWCVRGGHGVTRLMAKLASYKVPTRQKLFVGYSDITPLHLFLNQCWQWPSLHAPMASQVACKLTDPNDIASLEQLWFHGLANYQLTSLKPFNEIALRNKTIQGATIGTCLSLIQTSFATPWQINAQDKIVVLEDINESPYKLDRLLVHLMNAGIFNQAKALILGDFSEPLDSNIEQTLRDFVGDYLPKHHIAIPVFRIAGLGHGKRNQPLPLGVEGIIENNVLSFRS